MFIWFRQSNGDTIELIENPFLPWNRFPVDEHALQDNTIKAFFLLLSFTKCKKGGERREKWGGGGGGCVTDGLDTSG